uniref:Uncharacterized protein n=1 Tax=Rhizophora mucronata TaxID=61149 RepID=A0A2P2ILV4_RHIMU
MRNHYWKLTVKICQAPSYTFDNLQPGMPIKPLIFRRMLT